MSTLFCRLENKLKDSDSDVTYYQEKYVITIYFYYKLHVIPELSDAGV